MCVLCVYYVVTDYAVRKSDRESIIIEYFMYIFKTIDACMCLGMFVFDYLIYPCITAREINSCGIWQLRAKYRPSN